VFNLFSNTNNESNEIKSIKFNDFIVCVKKWVFLIYSPILWGQAALRPIGNFFIGSTSKSSIWHKTLSHVHIN
jgi:hypothetical protein